MEGFVVAFTGSHRYVLDYLTEEVLERQPGRIPELHRNAAAWYAERGLADDAIRHAVAAGEMTWAEEPFEPTIGRAGSLLVNVPVMIALARGYLAQLRGGDLPAERVRR